MTLHRLFRALVATAALGGWLAIGTQVFAADTPPQHIRGTLESVDGHMLSVKTARGTDAIKLADDAKVFTVSTADISAVKDGKFVGVTSVEKDGKRVAVEVHVFDDTLRGLGEGHYPWDLGNGPNMMTNANIAKVESVGGDRVLKLDYKGGTQDIAVPADAAIVEFTVGTPDQLKPNSKVFVIARKVEDGSFVAPAIVIGKDGIKPPM
jgi:hypothetical protein